MNWLKKLLTLLTTNKRFKMQDFKKAIKYYIYDLLSKREYSEKEIKEKLLTKFSKKVEKEEKSELKDQIEEVVQVFIDNKYLSNERYTEAKTRSLINRKNGPKKIEQELKMKGISESLIKQYLSENEDKLSEEILKLKEKYGSIEDQKEKQKIYRRLLYKGYTYDQVNEILK